MEPSAEKDELIQMRRAQAAAGYPAQWASLVAEWSSPGPDDRAWLIYAANYLFRTAGIRWGMDPLTLHGRLPEAPPVDGGRDLQDISFIILTHSHGDHLDLDLLRALRQYPIRFIVPEFLLPLVREQAGIPEEKIIVPVPLQPFEMDGIHLTPFDGLHLEDDPSRPSGLRGVPALGYLVEFSGKRWLFPGDTRVFDAAKLPAFGPVDGLFAHLWLGRASAMMDAPPLLDPFCRFCLDLQPGRVILSHLHEFHRSAASYWDDSHAALAAATMQKISPDTRVEFAHMGESVAL